MLEVLSPAGNFDALTAAVRSGADAVYLGSTEFSARRNAGNFDKAALKQAVEYCHIRGVKVYLTLNIMLKDHELSDALSLAEYASSVGVDALILQDLGIARLIKNTLPSMDLHASTQMSVHSPAAIPLLKEMGFCRVVAAREMSETELKALCDKAKEYGMTVEAFVHGALCMCVSGQCLLSAVLGSRSGNRGLCAGPCRLPFSAPGGSGYDLSLKDLSLFDSINRLRETGVYSLKIEGRMKRPEYVAAATSAARQAVDKGIVENELSCCLKDVFSRSGFTKGYFEGKKGRDMFGIRTKEDVVSANDAFAPLHELYRNERQSIPLDINIEIRENEKIKATASDGLNTVTVFGDIPQPAKSRPTDSEAVIASLKKLGGTPYFVKDIKAFVDDGLFVSASALNSVRRQFCEEISALRGSVKPFEKTDFCENYTDMPHNGKKIFVQFNSSECLPENLTNADGVILPFTADFSCLPENVIKIAETPRYIFDEENLKNRLIALKEQGVDYALCGNLSGVSVAKAAGMKIIGDKGLNAANSASAKTVSDMGIEQIVLSAENTLSEIEKIKTPLKKGIFAYGRLPLMLTVNCPLKNGRECKDCDKKGFLTDRMGKKFPVRCKFGYSELLNSAPVYLADRLSEIKNIDFIILSFTDEEKGDMERIIKEYKFGGKPQGEFTRGLYYRNVL